MLDCLRQAVELRPNDFGLRKRYALQLAHHAPGDTAIAQIRWCLQRKPNDPVLTRVMKTVTGKKIRDSSIAEATDEKMLRR